MQIAFGLGELRLGLLGRSLCVAELRFCVVVVFDRGLELIVEVVDARLESLGLAFGLGDRRGLSPRDVAPDQGGYREDYKDRNET